MSNALKLVLPKGWQLLERRADGYRCARGDLQVIVSHAYELDDKVWRHVSASRQTRMPSYSDLCEAKRLFIGADRFAYEVHAPDDEHVNLHPNVRHLWACLEGEAGAVLPATI